MHRTVTRFGLIVVVTIFAAAKVPAQETPPLRVRISSPMRKARKPL